MQIRDLEWLTLLAEYGQLTEVAAVLGVSQPTLSRALARIETELGCRLFERTAAGVAPNPYGELVVAGARDVLLRYTALTEELSAQLDPDSGIVRLAFLDSMATSLVPRLLGRFHTAAPNVRVLLRQEPGHLILADLAGGQADVAVTSPRPDGDHHWRPLQEERLVLVVPPGHRLSRRRRIGLAEAAGEELVTVPVGFGFRMLVDRLLAEAGVVLPVSFEGSDLPTIEGLVAAGLGVAILPAQFAGASGTVGIALSAEGARRTVGLAWRSDRPLAPAAARFLEEAGR